MVWKYLSHHTYMVFQCKVFCRLFNYLIIFNYLIYFLIIIISGGQLVRFVFLLLLWFFLCVCVQSWYVSIQSAKPRLIPSSHKFYWVLVRKDGVQTQDSLLILTVPHWVTCSLNVFRKLVALCSLFKIYITISVWIMRFFLFFEVFFNLLVCLT